ncbi:putative ABC transporter ATP-binding protein [compost metagenome]
MLITHDVQESFSIADQVYLVGQGKLAAAGTPETLSASQDPYVQQFLKGEPDGPVAFQYPETPAFQKWLSEQKGRKA